MSMWSNFRFSRFLRPVSFLIVAFAIMNSSACATGPSPVREVIIGEADGGMMDPHAMAQTLDGGLVIAGDARRHAYAIKTDRQGAVLWRHDADLTNLDDLMAGTKASYAGAATMADGSIYLCGSMPAPIGQYHSGLLSHLDRSAAVLKEQLVGPVNLGPNVIVSLTDCERWGDGVVVLGNVTQIVRVASGNDLPVVKYYYWIEGLDASGSKVWERLIPSALHNIDDSGPIIVLHDKSFVFAGSRNFENSEIFHLGPMGNILAESNSLGRFAMIKNISLNSPIRLLASKENYQWSIISLDDHLQQISRIESDAGDDKFLNHKSFSLPQNAIAIFGGSIHNFGEKYKSAVLWFDPSLQSHRILNLDQGPYRDGGHIEAVTPLADGGFVVARHLIGGARPEGIALDFISHPKEHP